jgi:hypothetical protein
MRGVERRFADRARQLELLAFPNTGINSQGMSYEFLGGVE